MVLKAHLDPVPDTLDERRDPRRSIMLETSGTLPDGQEANVTVHNISASGMLLETDLPLDPGETLVVDLPESGRVEASIIWQSERFYGCSFSRALSAGDLAAAELQSRARENAPAQPLETFGARLNRLRRERGLTLAQVADALDVSKPTVWAWEKGKARPLPERMEAIAEALGVAVDELGSANDAPRGSVEMQELRLRIATMYGTDPQNVRIMIEL